MVNKHAFMIALLSIHSSHHASSPKTTTNPTTSPITYAETTLNTKSQSSPTASTSSTDSKAKAESQSCSCASSASTPSMLSTVIASSSASSDKSTTASALTSSASSSSTPTSALSSSSASSTQSTIIAETQSKKTKKPAPLKLSYWRPVRNTDGSDVTSEITSLTDEQFMDANKDSENAKNLIRGFEFYSKANDRKGIVNLTEVCDQQYHSGNLVTNSPARGIARDFQEKVLKADEEQTLARVAQEKKEIAEWIAEHKKKLTDYLIAVYAQDLLNRGALDKTYSMGGNSTPRATKHPKTSDYDTAEKFAKNIGILTMIKDINDLKFDLRFEDITTSAHAEIKKQQQAQKK